MVVLGGHTMFFVLEKKVPQKEKKKKLTNVAFQVKVAC